MTQTVKGTFKAKHGLEATIPTLDEAVFGFTTDSNKVFVGSSNNGNVQLTKQADTDGINSRVGSLESNQMHPTVTEKFTATEGQTVFTLSSTTYTVGNGETSVEIDGIPQTVNDGYTETDSKTITLVEGVPAGSIVKLIVSEPPPGMSDKFASYDAQLAEIATQLSSFPRQSGETDDAPRLQRAINSLMSTGGTILLQDTNYIWKSGITTYNNIKIKGFNTVIDCSAIPTGTPAITVNGAVSGIRNGYMNILEGIQFKGNATVSDNPVSFTANSIGISFSTSHLKVKECSFTGFDKSTKFLTNAYIITFEECMFSYNNYGIHFDATGQSNLGEKIVFRGCTIGNNNYGIYNNLGELFFEHSSIDYNRVNHVADNITDNGGTASGVIHFDDCHMELTNAYNPSSNPRIINHGRMIIKGGAIWDDVATTTFNNSGTIIIDEILWRISEDGNYYHTGSGLIQVGRLIPISDDQNIRLIPALSGIQNHDFETGNTNGWTYGSGSSTSNVTVTNTAGNVFKGTYSLSVTSASASIGGEIDSSKVNVDPSKSFAQLTFYHKNASNLNVFVHLVFFDFGGNTLLDTYTTLNTNETSFSKSKISVTIPNGSTSYQVKANIGANATGNCYLDEFFMRVA